MTRSPSLAPGQKLPSVTSGGERALEKTSDGKVKKKIGHLGTQGQLTLKKSTPPLPRRSIALLPRCDDKCANGGSHRGPVWHR